MGLTDAQGGSGGSHQVRAGGVTGGVTGGAIGYAISRATIGATVCATGGAVFVDTTTASRGLVVGLPADGEGTEQQLIEYTISRHWEGVERLPAQFLQPGVLIAHQTVLHLYRR